MNELERLNLFRPSFSSTKHPRETHAAGFVLHRDFMTLNFLFKCKIKDKAKTKQNYHYYGFVFCFFFC